MVAQHSIIQQLLVASFVLGGVTFPSLLSSAAESSDTAASPASSGVWVTSIASIGGDQFVAATADGLLLRESAVCRFSAQDPGTLEAIYKHPAGVWAVAASADGKLVASSDYRGNLGVYKVDGGEVQMHDKALERWSQALAFAPDGGSIVAGNEAGKVFVFDVAAGKVSKSLELGEQAIASVAFSPDGSRIAASDGSGTVHWVSWPEFAATGKTKISEEATTDVKFVDDNTIVVGSYDRHLYRCEAKPDATPESILSGGDWITKIALNSNGQIAASEVDGAVHVTSLAGGGSELSAPSTVWSVAWNGPTELFVGTRKNGVVIAAQSWSLTERKPQPAAEEKPADEAAADEAKPDAAADAKPDAAADAKPEAAADAKPGAAADAKTEAPAEPAKEDGSESKPQGENKDE